MKRKTKKWIKNHLNFYNISILLCIIIILVSLFIIFKPKGEKAEKKKVNGVEVIASNIKEEEEITEKEARKMAKQQFKKLGENIAEDDLNLTTIRRSGELYYYVQSKNNTLEIKIKGGEITRINTVIVE